MSVKTATNNISKNDIVFHQTYIDNRIQDVVSAPSRGYFYANAEISIDAPIHGFGYPNPPSDHIRFRRKISGGGKLYATFFEATFGFSGAIPSLSASVTGAKDNSMYCSIAVIPESS